MNTMSSSSRPPPPPIGRMNYLNAVAYASNVAVTYAIGAAGVFGRPTNAELSARYQTIVTPAGWAFAIWGVIFIVQLLWTIAQLLPTFRAHPLVVEGVSWYYVAVCAAQIVWTVTFGFELMWLAFASMLCILYFLLKIVMSQYMLGGSAIDTSEPLSYYWILRFPFSIHCGWIIAASLVNLNLVLVYFDASSTFQFIVALSSLVVLLLANTYFLHLTNPDFVIPCVSVWALIGIGQELKNPNELIVATFSETQISVARTSSLVIVILLLVATMVRAYFIIKRNSNSRHRHHDEDDLGGSSGGVANYVAPPEEPAAAPQPSDGLLSASSANKK